MKPPEHLKPAGAELWAEIQKQYAIVDAGGLALLTTAAECLDRMRAAQLQIAEGGEFTADRYGQLRVSPACQLEKESRAGYLLALKQLNLDLEPLRDRATGWR
jgi:hypothetical protein